MKIVYVAGPYSSNNVIGILDNMRRGMKLGHKVLRAGFAPFIPWFDYHFSLVDETTLQEYYNYSIAFLERADYVLCALPEWENSKGTINELKRAKELNIPIFYSLEDLITHENLTK